MKLANLANLAKSAMEGERYMTTVNMFEAKTNLSRYVTSVENGTEPRYTVLKRQGYKVLILEKDLVFYKIDENHRNICLTFTVNGIDKG